MNIPIYNVAGWFDMFAKGGINKLCRAAISRARRRARESETVDGAVGGIRRTTATLEYIGERGLPRAFEEEMRWFAHWLKGEDTGIMDEPAMKYYHLASARKGAFSGKGGFRETDEWPPLDAVDTRFYLREGGAISTTRPSADGSTTSYVARYRRIPSPPTAARITTTPGATIPITVGPVDQRVIGERPRLPALPLSSRWAST